MVSITNDASVAQAQHNLEFFKKLSRSACWKRRASPCGLPIQANRKRTYKSRAHLSADAALIVFTLTPAL